MIKTKIYNIFKLLTKFDFLIISIILLSALFHFLYLIIFNKEKQTITIVYNNEIFAIIPLNTENTIFIDSLAIIEIQNQNARISYSTCKNQHCVQQNWSNRQPIICVPNKILINFSYINSHDNERLFITH